VNKTTYSNLHNNPYRKQKPIIRSTSSSHIALPLPSTPPPLPPPLPLPPPTESYTIPRIATREAYIVREEWEHSGFPFFSGHVTVSKICTCSSSYFLHLVDTHVIVISRLVASLHCAALAINKQIKVPPLVPTSVLGASMQVALNRDPRSTSPRNSSPPYVHKL
jgi:hypothetical protein